jgi:5-methyltetrahydrofolate--homocysteine methyltransferase
VWKDLHDIGKNLLKVVLEGDGFEVVDLGTSVAPGEFLAAVGAHPDATVIGMSALLTTTMKHMKATIDALVAAGARNQIKVIVGGAPVTEGFAAEIGADAYASDANAAKLRIRELCAIGQTSEK